MNLRSSRLRRDVSSKVDFEDDVNMSKVNIDDLNLIDESGAVSSELGEAESNKTEGKSNGFSCEIEAGHKDECMGTEVKSDNTGGQKYNDIGMMQDYSTEAGRANVGAEGEEVGGERLNCAVGLSCLSPCSSLAVVVKSSQNDEEKMVCQGEEEEVKEKCPVPNVGLGQVACCPLGLVISETVDGCGVSESNSSPVCVNVNQKDESKEEHTDCGQGTSRNEETNFGDLILCSEKKSVRQFSQGKSSQSLDRGSEEGRIQVVGKVLRSRCVPANGLTDEDGGTRTRASSNKRKREYGGREEVAVTLKYDAKSLPVDSIKTCNSVRAIDLSDGKVMKLNNAPRVSRTEDEDAHEKSVRRSVSKKKRGRPKKSTYHSEEQACHMDEVQAVSEVEDEDLNIRSTLSLKKNKYGKSETFDFSKKEGEVSKIKSEARDASKKSVECSTLTRRSERSKRFVDYCENDAVKRKKVPSFKVDDDSKDENTIVSSRTGASSKKKGKRGRPKKERGNGAVKKNSQDREGKTKVYVPRGGPSSKEVSSDTKMTPVGPDQADGTSKGEDFPLTENSVSVKGKGGEAPGSRAAEKAAIRNQIVDMLLRAGWTVEYRPRNGREYSDAVYVNREGKTHWSVTKAYSTLRREFENGKVSDFIPLPEEVLSKLFKVMSKTRSDKNKKKKHKGDSGSSDEDDSRDKRRNKAIEKRKYSVLKKKSSVKGGSQSKRRCALVARRSKGLISECYDVIAHSGKHSILAWMIDSGTLSLDEKVLFMNHRKTKTILEGSITRDGIHCRCCKEVISVSEFEMHAGSIRCQRFENLYLESGPSLLQCLLDSWNKQESAGLIGYHRVNVDADDPSDDTCAICGDGGDLMCCDSCPSTFHHDCLEMEEVPSGEWNCVYCSCKFCGTVGEDIDDCDPDSSSLVTCCLCKEKYHQSCVDEEEVVHIKSGRPTFCDKNCQQIYDKLQRLIGVKAHLEDGYSWTLLQRSEVKAEAVLLESQKIQDNSKLAVALSVMDECFVPIVDLRSGINLIRHVVYNCGSNFNRLNFSSFFTIVLENGDEVISAASVRIHGKQLAEMPFIGTRNVYRRQGMCRRLLTAIELALSSLDIDNLVIPAVPEVRDTWTSVFGFEPIQDTVKECMRSMNVMVFAHTDMLQKPLSKHDLGGERCIENNANCPNSSVEQLSSGADKYEVDDGCANGPFDLNVVAPAIPESSSDDQHVNYISESCGAGGKCINGFGESGDADKVQGQPSAKENSGTQMENFVEVNMCGGSVNPESVEPSSDINCLVHPCSAIVNSSEAAKNTGDSCGLLKLDCSTDESYCGGNSASKENTFGERTLNPGLKLMGANVSELNHCSQPNAVDHDKGGVHCIPARSDSCKKQNICFGEAAHLSSLDASSEADILRSDVNTTDNHSVGTVPLGATRDFGSEVSFSSDCEFHEMSKTNLSDRAGVSL